MEEKCKYCKFFRDKTDRTSHVFGECRRYPPRMIDKRSLFPTVSVEMWCGEFKENTNNVQH